MRISKEKAAENRVALIRAASRLFRERGIDGVGVAEISKEAGLTHGALYAHFKSKDELALAALSYGLDEGAARLLGGEGHEGVPDVAAYLDHYLSPAHRDDPIGRCAIAASTSEFGRQGPAISARFAQGYLTLVAAFERQIAANDPASDAHARALVAVATIVGSQAVAHGVARADRALSDEVLAATRRLVDELMLAPDAPAP
jgi:TetR/AcrR family transcriptional repressor of nem operon